MQEQETVLRLARLLYDRKANDIVVLNVSHLTVLCDHMVIASGRTDNQVSSLADAVDEMMAKEGVILRRSEGRREGRLAAHPQGGHAPPQSVRLRRLDRQHPEPAL